PLRSVPAYHCRALRADPQGTQWSYVLWELLDALGASMSPSAGNPGAWEIALLGDALHLTIDPAGGDLSVRLSWAPLDRWTLATAWLSLEFSLELLRLDFADDCSGLVRADWARAVIVSAQLHIPSGIIGDPAGPIVVEAGEMAGLHAEL